MTWIGGDPRITERCPFCGAKGIIVRADEPDSIGRIYEWVECSNNMCGAMGPVAHRPCKTHIIAINKWNRRVSP